MQKTRDVNRNAAQYPEVKGDEMMALLNKATDHPFPYRTMYAVGM